MNPIVGYRYTDGKGYDLCQSEFDKLSANEQGRFKQVAPPVTPRRALIAAVAVAVAVQAIARPSGSERPGTRVLSGYADSLDDLEEILELPPLSPAEELVGLIFKPKVPAGEREADPTARRRVG